MQPIRLALISCLTAVALFGASGPAKTQVARDGPTTTQAAKELSKDEVRDALEVLNRHDQARVFSCQAMVVAVNGLRHLGKDEALKMLREYYSVKYTNDSIPETREMVVICVCRLLFIPPKDGWKEPWIDYKYMMDNPGYDVAARKKFPLYPMALSDGVPFQLNVSWNRPNGRAPEPPDEGNKTLNASATLELIAKNLPTSGYVAAAKKLTESDDFNRLSPSMTPITEVRDWIVAQAANPPIVRSKVPTTTSATTTATGPKP